MTGSAKQPAFFLVRKDGLLCRCAPRNDGASIHLRVLPSSIGIAQMSAQDLALCVARRRQSLRNSMTSTF